MSRHKDGEVIVQLTVVHMMHEPRNARSCRLVGQSRSRAAYRRLVVDCHGSSSHAIAPRPPFRYQVAGVVFQLGEVNGHRSRVRRDLAAPSDRGR